MKNIILTFLLLIIILPASAQNLSKKKLGFVPYTDPDFTEEEYKESVYKHLYEAALRIFINTQRFIILDRGSFNILKIEKEFQKGDDLVNSELIAQGRILAAQILAIAKITTLSVSLNEDGKTYTTYIVCEFKQIDVETGKAINALQLQGSSKDIGGRNPASAGESISRAVKKMEKDLEKWVKENFPLAMKVLEINEDTKSLIAEGGRESGLSKSYKLRVIKMKMVNGKKFIETIGKLSFSDEGVGEETTKLLIPNEAEWYKFLNLWKEDKTSILVFEDNR
jgi:hypothetical protein